MKKDEKKLLKLEKKILRKNKKIEKKRLKKSQKALKKEAKLEKKDLKLKKKAEKRAIHRAMNEPPHLYIDEEIGNAVSHGAGVLIAISALVLMICFSDNVFEYLGAFLYGISMIAMMLMSCLYHSFKSGSTVKRLWRRFDYSSIYLLIGGTFAPLFLVFVGGTLGIVLLCVQWAIIITGITFVSIYGPGRIKWLHFTLYFVLGWSGIGLMPYFIMNNIKLLIWILGGGVIYTLGMLPFSVFKKMKNAHLLWHYFVLGGFIVQWLGIFLHLYLN